MKYKLKKIGNRFINIVYNILHGIWNGIKFIGDCINTLRWLMHVLIKNDMRNPYKKVLKSNRNTINVLANGPSLNGSILHFSKDKIECEEFIGVNQFCLHESFKIIKPKYYCLSDTLFFQETSQKDKGLQTDYALRDIVDWPMTLFVPHCHSNTVYLNTIIKANPLINVVYFSNAPIYFGIDKLRCFFSKKGWFSFGPYGTVALDAICASIMIGFKHINVYGIDHNYFESLVVSDDNILMHRVQHFNDLEVEFHPIINHVENKNLSMDMFLAFNHNVFLGHKVMAEFAKYMGAEIINCTPGSMVDAYPRRK